MLIVNIDKNKHKSFVVDIIVLVGYIVFIDIHGFNIDVRNVFQNPISYVMVIV